jgi:tetratricopeptide (TPR) repeat protein
VSALVGRALLLILLTPAGATRPAPVDSLDARRLAHQCAALTKEPAIAACQSALALGLSPERAANAQQLLALNLSALDRWEEVVAAYRELARLRPKDATAHWRLGDAFLYGLGRPLDALPHLREAVRLAPALTGAQISLGVALNESGAHAEAVQAFEEAQRLDPRCFDVHPSARNVFDAARRGER